MPPAARRSSLKTRHVVLIGFFLLWVVAPLGAAAWYLYVIAEDQYASNVGFSVRTEEVGSAVELLGGITELSGSSSSDTDILYEYIGSQNMVRAIHDRIDLRAVYVNPDDPIFSLGEDARIEALSSYWRRMVKVFYDRASGLIEVRVLAFDPDDAHRIATAIFEESTDMVNELSAIARADATRYAREELDRAIERLKEARTAMTDFRSRTQIVDPSADIQGRMGLLNTLQQQLADALIELDLLLENSSPEDPRVVRARERVEVIRNRIRAERARFGRAGEEGAADTGEALSPEGPADGYSTLVAEYESLAVDLEFAEKSYLSALAAYDSSVAEAQRQSRYLAAYLDPTIPETPQYPRKVMLLALAGAFLLVSWSIIVMIYYSLRDRR
ncbi:sugar transporter [Rhodosalinus halophilus]|uniref:Sugar transporter n=1 Tax=Rhodosalinus halophilus TaxID=2259333 RepID=A0A365U9B4_9RHOB|nr:sugar transporter [Rhodosalinus halophilus]RBI84731.1 sugar transporter [Rhodosalinus halophilus]